MNTSTIQTWLDDLDARRRSQAEELATLVTAADPRLDRAIKWGRITFTLAGNWHHWLCQIAALIRSAITHQTDMLD